jgi:hypothetical protein
MVRSRVAVCTSRSKFKLPKGPQMRMIYVVVIQDRIGRVAQSLSTETKTFRTPVQKQQ